MSGPVFHMMVYAGTGDNPILAVLNDEACFTGCLRWNQTHSKKVLRQFSGYLSEKGADDIYRGMASHIRVDEAMHGPESPGYLCMVDIEEKLRKDDILYTSDDNYPRMAEFIMETSLDGVVMEKNRELSDIILQAQKELDLERISRLFAGFYRVDERKLREGLEPLKKISFDKIASIDGLARARLGTYKTAMNNLSDPESLQVFQTWYDYLGMCFTDPEKTERLRKLEESSKPALREVYELTKNIDFRDNR